MNVPATSCALPRRRPGVLHQRLPDPLRDRADQLARGKRVIEHDAGIVDRRVIDRSSSRRCPDRSRPRRRGQPFGKVCAYRTVALVSSASPCCFMCRRDRKQRHAAVRADDQEASVLVGDVGFRRLEQPRSIGFAFFQHQVDGAIERCADRHGGARATARISAQVEIGVAVAVRNLRRRNAEPRGDQARIDRGVALPGVLHADAEHEILAPRTAATHFPSAARRHVRGSRRRRCP